MCLCHVTQQKQKHKGCKTKRLFVLEVLVYGTVKFGQGSKGFKGLVFKLLVELYIFLGGPLSCRKGGDWRTPTNLLNTIFLETKISSHKKSNPYIF